MKRRGVGERRVEKTVRTFSPSRRTRGTPSIAARSKKPLKTSAEGVSTRLRRLWSRRRPGVPESGLAILAKVGCKGRRRGSTRRQPNREHREGRPSRPSPFCRVVMSAPSVGMRKALALLLPRRRSHPRAGRPGADLHRARRAADGAVPSAHHRGRPPLGRSVRAPSRSRRTRSCARGVLRIRRRWPRASWRAVRGR